MTFKIMMWNAQGLHSPQGDKKESLAFQEKVEFLQYAVDQEEDIDLLALFETSRVGTDSKALVAALAPVFTLITAAGPEDASSPVFGLGTMIFAKKSDSAKYVRLDTVLDYGQKRAPMFIQIRETKTCFAFLHANASKNAVLNVLSSIQDAMKTDMNLVFFGGDLNMADANDSFSQFPWLKKLPPKGSGYTHASIDENNVVKLSMLDIAYVSGPWQGKCEASLMIGKNEVTKDDFVSAAALSASSASSASSSSSSLAYKKFEFKETTTRLWKAMKMRSDHYPVVYFIDDLTSIPERPVTVELHNAERADRLKRRHENDDGAMQ